MGTSNASAGKIGELGGSDENGKIGPTLAQARAEKIAKATGGEIVIKQTALSQNLYEALPKPTANINTRTLERDENYIMMLKMQLARESFERETKASMEKDGQNIAATSAKIESLKK